MMCNDCGKKIQEQITNSNAQVRQQIATFLAEPDDVLLAAGLEPLITDASEQLELASLFDGFPPLEKFSFEVPSIIFDENATSPWPQLEIQSVEVATIVVVEKTQSRTFQDYSEQLLPRKGIDLEMVAISGGTFLMGSPDNESDAYSDEKPQHKVTVADFYIGRYLITQAQWEVVMDRNSSRFKGDNLPVERVSWEEAVEFCDRLTKNTGKQYRLPTEAEWEYACRAGSATKYYFGDEKQKLDHYAWYDGNSKSKTHPVGEKQPNQFGLYDLHGNVWEWCLDHWHDNYEGAPTNGSAWLNEDNEGVRVIRGGAWLNFPRNCRSACRVNYIPGARYFNIGFRVVCVP